MTATVDTVRRVYDAFAAQDMETLAGLLGDTEWYEAAGMPYGGTYRGLAEIGPNVFGPIGNDIAGFTAVPDEILPIGDDRAVALGHYRGTGKAGPLDVPFAHFCTVADGRISRFVQYADTHLWRQAMA